MCIPSRTTTENGEGVVALIVWFRYYNTIPRNCRLLIFFFSLCLSSSSLHVFIISGFSLSTNPPTTTAKLHPHFSLFSLSLSFGLINTQRETHTHTHTVAKQTRNEQSRRGVGASICLVGLISVQSGQLETLFFFPPFCCSFW